MGMHVEARSKAEVVEGLPKVLALVEAQNNLIFDQRMSQALENPGQEYKQLRAESGLVGIELESRPLLDSAGLKLVLDQDNALAISSNFTPVKPAGKLHFEIADGEKFVKTLASLSRSEVYITELGITLSKIFKEALQSAIAKIDALSTDDAALDTINFFAKQITEQFDRLGLSHVIDASPSWRRYLKDGVLRTGLMLEREELVPLLSHRRPPATWLYDQPRLGSQHELPHELLQKWNHAYQVLHSLPQGLKETAVQQLLAESVNFLTSELNSNISTLNQNPEMIPVTDPATQKLLLKILIQATRAFEKLARDRKLPDFSGPFV